MSKNISMELLCQILVAIREGKSIYRKGKSYSQPEMSKLVNEIIEKNDKYKRNGIEAMSKDYLRRMEQNRLKPEITLVYAELYYEVFELPEETREKIRNSSRIVVLDITALMSMPHILKTFGSEYYKIIICDFVSESYMYLYFITKSHLINYNCWEIMYETCTAGKKHN